jgi:hypothetical protein
MLTLGIRSVTLPGEAAHGLPAGVQLAELSGRSFDGKQRVPTRKIEREPHPTTWHKV